VTGRALTLSIAFGLTASLHAQHGPAAVTAAQRFLARGDSPPVAYRALRHLEAHNSKFGANAWMDVWTEFDEAHGLRYDIVGEGGNSVIRKKVLRAALEGEQKMWQAREPQRASITTENYLFDDAEPDREGLAAVGIKPKRKDVLLVEGAIFVVPTGDDGGELKRIEGKLSKTPSIWTRRVDIVRQYEKLAGVRVPVSIESTASVLIAGKSTFKMTYDYEIVNGQKVGSPRASRTPESAAH
jgi:hypothetical protein